MARVNINILGIMELKWTGMGEFNSDDHYIYYRGQESLRRNGVVLIVKKRAWNAILGSNLKNNRMISVIFQGKPFNITVIQVYSPTSIAEEAEVELSYEYLQALVELTAPKDLFFIIGDWNAKVRSQEIPGVIGKFSLGVENEAGQRLTEFCQENTLVIANTLFQQHKRRLHMDITKWSIQKSDWEDGRGIGWGDHFLPHKFIERSFECWANTTKQLLNTGRGHQAPRKAAHCLQKEVGQNIKDKKRDKRKGWRPVPGREW